MAQPSGNAHGYSASAQPAADARLSGLPRKRAADSDAKPASAVASSSPKKRLAALPSDASGESGMHAIAASSITAGQADAPSTAAPRSFLDIPSELRTEILLRVALSEPRNADDLQGAALASRASYVKTKPFLEAPAAKAAKAASTHAEVKDAYREEILALPRALRVRHIAQVLARWPKLSDQDQVTVVPTLMAMLDSISEIVKPSTHRDEDPFAVAAHALSNLETGKATDLGFDCLVSRIAKLPLAQDRERHLCEAIPKLSPGRRFGAFELMLNHVAVRRTQGANRSGLFYPLVQVIPSLAASDQANAAGRLFLKAKASGATGYEIYRMLAQFPLEHVDPACRLALFNDMIRLGSNLSALLRAWLAKTARPSIAALDAQHRRHAYAQLASLRPSLQELIAALQPNSNNA
jgi:hypothetical protein